MSKNQKFIEFLDTIKVNDPSLVESIEYAYMIIHESSEIKVEQIKEALGTPESNENPLDEEPIVNTDEQNPELPNI